VLLGSVALGAGRGHRAKPPTIPRSFFEGKELFEKSWEPGKASPIGGDGLGPLHNETSCVGCHHLGGTGGGGANESNVVMLSAIASSSPPPKGDTVFQGELEALHPGFGNGASIVLHRHATDAQAQERLGKIGSFSAVQTHQAVLTLRKGQRNTPALFGSGLIDALPDEVLRAAEKRSFAQFPEIKGRVSELPGGRLGRFGWKAQVASLDEFVRAACSNELGLEVPGHHQASLASAQEAASTKVWLDMDEDQCALLSGFVRHLAAPLRRAVDNGTLPPWGLVVFHSIGCATCHAPQLGAGRGLYSDLLLHDMGESSSDSALYYGAPVAPAPSGELAQGKEPARRSGMATASEWRTPPLWGVADSAPYLHNGRARTLEEAILFHDGEAAKTRTRYTRLDPYDRKALLAFLGSLTVAPRTQPRKPAEPPPKRAGGRLLRASQDRIAPRSGRGTGWGAWSGLVATGL
jgi:CxxC motif-containing protein (DUF1111 family)